jgi:hypothetical protein
MARSGSVIDTSDILSPKAENPSMLIQVEVNLLAQQ